MFRNMFHTLRKGLAALLRLALLAVLLIALTACASEKRDQPAEEAETVTELSLWAYPVGGWADRETVEGLMADFEAATGIRVTVECLGADGDDTVRAAIDSGATPDLILGSPEGLTADWGARGLMVDLNDLLDETDLEELDPIALTAFTAPDGGVYGYPVAVMLHAMAINRTVFEAAGAMQYIDVENRTWNSVADFVAAVQAVYERTGSRVGAVYCGGQEGDQGTRALVNNLYGGTFTDAEHTMYTWDSSGNIAALQALRDCSGMDFDPEIDGSDETAMFVNGTLNMAFCWDAAQQCDPNAAGTGAGLTADGDEILFLAFPSDVQPQLCSSLWGFGVFDNADAAKVEAAGTFLRYMCDSGATADVVMTAGCFPVRDIAEGNDLSGIWADNQTMTAYSALLPMLGDYYPVTDGFAQARTAWWNLLQAVGSGEDITTAVETWTAEANRKE